MAVVAIRSQVGLLSFWDFMHSLDLIGLVAIRVAVASERGGVEVIVGLFLEIREEGVILVVFFLLLLDCFLLGLLHELVEGSRGHSA